MSFPWQVTVCSTASFITFSHLSFSVHKNAFIPLSQQCVAILSVNHRLTLDIEEQVDHFLEYGYIVVKEAFTKEKAAEWTKGLWVRLGLDPDDKATWDRERIHMPVHRREEVSSFSPKVKMLFSSIDDADCRLGHERHGGFTWG